MPVLTLGALALAFAAGPIQPAAAQCLLCAGDARNPSDAIDSPEDMNERPLRVEITADLDFSRLVVGNTGGNVRIDPATGHRLVTGDVHSVAATGFSGRIHIEGAPGRMVRIVLPNVVALTSTSGGRVMVSGLTTGAASVVRIGPDGRLDVALGGQLQLSGAVDGDFRGRIPVTVSYE
ncbi:MAG: DUF4402 domain-containing protein [Sphingopyxis sp.]